jgi:hypothetical protein
MSKPKIRTAVPQRRYQLGAFTVVLLGEIDSADATEYRYIAAVVREGDPEPGLYVAAEHDAGERRSDESYYDMRVIMREGSQVVGRFDRWADLDTFAAAAFRVITTILDLGDEQPYLLS